jgi:hypothetical protein
VADDPNYESLLAQARRARGQWFTGERIRSLFRFNSDHGVITMPTPDTLPDARFGAGPRLERRWTVTMQVNPARHVYANRGPGTPATSAVGTKIDQRQHQRTVDGRYRKGRVLHLRRTDSNQLVASIAFHLPSDDALPIEVLAIGMAGPPVSAAEAVVGAWVLKQYLHALAPITVSAESPARTDRLIYQLENTALTDQLTRLLAAIGFRRTAIRHRKPAATAFRQEAG